MMFVLLNPYAMAFLRFARSKLDWRMYEPKQTFLEELKRADVSLVVDHRLSLG